MDRKRRDSDSETPFQFGFLKSVVEGPPQEKAEPQATPQENEEKQLFKQPQERQASYLGNEDEKAKKENEELTTSGDARGSSSETFKETSKMEKATMKLNVVTLCDEWGSSKGGISTFNRELAIHLAKNSDLKVCCYLPEFSDSDKKAAEKDKVTLVKAKDIPGNRDPLVKLHHWPSHLFSPDVIISHGRKFGCPAFLIKERYPGCKWVHFVHVNYEVGDNEIKNSNDKDSDEVSCCRSADVVVAVGPLLFDRCKRSLSIDKVKEFHPGLSEEFRKIEDDKKAFHVYIFCRCSSEDFELRGVDVLANAVVTLGEMYKVHVVGVKENEEENTFRRILEESEITKNQLYVREYCNDREQLKRMLCEADLVVMPSRAEAFGLIGLEALSAGVPLLVSAASGLGMTLKELTSGEICVVESDDPQEWVRRIESVRGKNRSLRYYEMELLKVHYDEKYKWKRQCSKLAELFLTYHHVSFSGVKH